MTRHHDIHIEAESDYAAYQALAQALDRMQLMPPDNAPYRITHHVDPETNDNPMETDDE